MNTYVLSVGGSLIVPDQIDVNFLKNLQKIIAEQVQAGNKFVIITGGGSVARKYQTVLQEFFANADALDWIGIEATRLNAKLVSAVLHAGEIFTDPESVQMDKPVLIGGGWKPGWSTDYVAVYLAKKIGAKIVVNLSNIDYVYDKNPKEFADAKPIEKINWNDFKKLVGGEWIPGANLPFDPIASKLAADNNLSVVVMNGGKLDHLENFLQKKAFVGTTISG